MLIRAWEQGDLDSINRIEQASFSDPWSKKMLEDAMGMPRFLGFVIEEQGDVIGYIGASFVLDEGEILLVAVDETKRGNGYGKLLVSTLIEELSKQGVSVVFLEVRKSNSRAIACYEGCGFSKISERARYYGDGEDAIIMERKI